jgi:hypothetical protein
VWVQCVQGSERCEFIVFRVLGGVSSVCLGCWVVLVQCVQGAEWREFIVFRVLSGMGTVCSGCWVV